jgi:prevent-host-death family protein
LRKLDKWRPDPKLTGFIDRLYDGKMASRKPSQGFSESAVPFQAHTELREVQASVAKTHFSQLLDEVERGATIVVLRHGKPVARIVPDPERRRQRAAEAIENIRKLGEKIRARHGGMTVEEIISSIHEGHKY